MARPSAAAGGPSDAPRTGTGTTGSAVGPDPSADTDVRTSINATPDTTFAVVSGDVVSTDLRAGVDGLEVQEVPERAQAPIKWPRPDRPTLAWVAVAVVGLVIALVVPASIVPPSATDPQVGRIWLAFSFTVLGAVVMLVAAAAMWRRTREPLVLVMGAVPAFTVLVGGIILAMTKVFETRGYGT
jgi:hypothetical protein